jgi:hypothetical protein
MRTNDAELNHAHGTLWGACGGQLEYVSQDIEWRKIEGTRETYTAGVLIRFTDHDVQMTEEGERRFYELWFPLSALKLGVK